MDYLGLYRPTSPHPVKVDVDRTDLVTFALTIAFGAPTYNGNQLWSVKGKATARKLAWEHLRRQGWLIDEVQVHRKRKAA